MNDLQLANLLTMECARLDATRLTALQLEEGISPQPHAISPPKLFFWSPERTSRPERSTSLPRPPPAVLQDPPRLNAATNDPPTTYRSTIPLVRRESTGHRPAKTRNDNGKRSRPEDHETGYVKPPKSKRRPNGWWTLPQYAHLPKPTYAKAQHEKSRNIRGITRVQGTAIQASGITSITHPDRFESCCDNGTYGGVCPNVTVPPVMHPHVPPRRNSDGTFLNVPAFDAPGDVCQYLPPPGEIHTGFDPKWYVRVPAYMTMEAVLELAINADTVEVVGMPDVHHGNQKLRGSRNKGKHAAARELAQQQRNVRKVIPIKRSIDVIAKFTKEGIQGFHAGARETMEADEAAGSIERAQGCNKRRCADQRATAEGVQREVSIDSVELWARRQHR